MAINWSSLTNMTAINFNTTALSDPTEITTHLIDNADMVSEGYLGLGIMIVTFLVLLVLLYRDDGDIKLDIVRSIMLSGGFTLILGVVGLSLNIFSSFTHAMWFFIIFGCSVIAILFLKKKNL